MQESKFIHGYDMRYTDECLHEVYEKRLAPIECKDIPLSVSEIENGYALPYKHANNKKVSFLGCGGIADKFGKIYEEAALKENRVTLGYDFDSQNVLYDDREVIFAGIFWEHWGHFILEQVSRLWYFLEEEEDKNKPIVYIADKPLEGNFLEFFELLGIDTSRLIWVDKVTKFRKIIVPEASMISQTYYTKEYQDIYKKVVSKIKPNEKQNKRVFYTTSKFHLSSSKDFGELREIEDFFAQNGYEIISPERKTLREQIEILQSCETLVSISGTLPHNILFAHEDIIHIILNKSYVINFQQTLIDTAKGIKPIYIDTHLSIFPAHIGFGPFYFTVTDNLNRYAKDNNMTVIVSNKEKYFKKFFDNYLEKKYWKKKLAFGKLDKKIKRYYLNQLNGFGWYKFLIKTGLYKLLSNVKNIELKLKTTKIILKTH